MAEQPKVIEYTPLDQVPGYLEAVAKEDRARLLAFFDEGFEVCGFRIAQLTLRRLLALELIKSPFLSGDIPSPSELENFLWAMSPQFGDVAKRKKFHKRCVRMLYPSKRRWLVPVNFWAMREAKKTQIVAHIIDKILASMERDFMDAPRNLGGSNSTQKTYYHFAVSTIAKLPRFSMPDVLDMPLALLFQFLRERRQSDAREAASVRGVEFNSPLSNPSDRVRMQFCRKAGGN
jgi:hypothetical protein